MSPFSRIRARIADWIRPAGDSTPPAATTGTGASLWKARCRFSDCLQHHEASPSPETRKKLDAARSEYLAEILATGDVADGLIAFSNGDDGTGFMALLPHAGTDELVSALKRTSTIDLFIPDAFRAIFHDLVARGYDPTRIPHLPRKALFRAVLADDPDLAKTALSHRGLQISPDWRMNHTTCQVMRLCGPGVAPVLSERFRLDLEDPALAAGLLSCQDQSRLLLPEERLKEALILARLGLRDDAATRDALRSDLQEVVSAHHALTLLDFTRPLGAFFALDPKTLAWRSLPARTSQKGSP